MLKLAIIFDNFEKNNMSQKNCWEWFLTFVNLNDNDHSRQNTSSFENVFLR